MNEAVTWLPAWFAGFLLGVVFFGGLWWTIQVALASQKPGLCFLASLLARTSMVMAGFYVVGGDRWDRLLACLFGFFVARVIITRLAGPPIALRQASTEEARHAP